MAVFSILAEIKEERNRQNTKWGEQNHPNGTGGVGSSELAEFYRKTCDYASACNQLTWRDILLEETFEALAEDDPKELRKELVQASAVIVAWVEAIDRAEREFKNMGPVALG